MVSHQVAVTNRQLTPPGRTNTCIIMISKTVLTVQVPILDPQIHMKPGYAPYDQGIAQGVFIRGMTGQPYIGQACTADPIPSKPVLQVQACELDVS